MTPILLLAGAAALPAVARAEGEGWATAVQIPVIVNIYDNAVTNAEAERIIEKEANKFIKQLNMQFKIVKDGIKHIQQNDGAPDTSHGGDDGSGVCDSGEKKDQPCKKDTDCPDGGTCINKGTAGDGNFTSGERKKIRDFGKKEIKGRTRIPNGIGIKVAFGKQTSADDDRGISVHKNSTIIVRKSTAEKADEESVEKDTGRTIAHELGHVMTLTAGHKVGDGLPDADDKGHSSGNDHTMNPNVKGNKFTDAQKEEMLSRWRQHGKCATQWKADFAAKKNKRQLGTTSDKRCDTSGGGRQTLMTIYDLLEVFLTSFHETEVAGDVFNINAELTVAGALPTDEEINAVYSLGFDIDDNVATGVTYAGYDGIDRIVYVSATGNMDLGTFVVTGEVEDTISMTTDPLPESPVAETEHEFSDPSAGFVPVATSLDFKIPKDLLNLAAVEMPVVATAGTDLEIFDTTDNLVFDSEAWLKDPTLQTFGTGVPTPGAAYPFDISGLEPNSPFDLYLDGTVVLSDTLDATGSFSGDFVFPEDMSKTEMHFLTAQDSTGEFGYSMTCPQPLGACCTFPDKDCFVTSEKTCQGIGGFYVGDGMVCLGDNNGDGQDDACGEAIPTASEWGLVVLTLLLLAAGKIYFSYRRTRQPA